MVFACGVARGHDPITTQLTWDREISRIVYARCASCHRQGGTAFSLMTYQEARPWAKSIEEETLERRMPPWGAVKGFGDFRNDQGLTQNELELISDWVDGTAPEGDPKDLPPEPKVQPPSPVAHPADEIVAGNEFKLQRPLRLDGLWPNAMPDGVSVKITAELPDGSIEPLVWLEGYNARYGHAFLLRTPLDLPAGTVIHGIPPGLSLCLLPATSPPSPGRQSEQYSPRPSAETAPKPGKSSRGEK
jgi:hypothetical protein